MDFLSQTKIKQMLKKQSNKTVIQESDQDMSDIEKAIAVAPTARRPVTHPISVSVADSVAQEEPNENDEKVEIEFMNSESDDDSTPEDGEASESDGDEGPEAGEGEVIDSDEDEHSDADEADSDEADSDEADSDEDESDESESDESESDESESDEDEDEDEADSEEDPGSLKYIKDPEADMEEDVNALISGENNLTEGFKAKAKVIFEAAVKSKVRAGRKQLYEAYKVKLATRADEILNTVTEQVDSYLTYVVESWIKNNQVAIDSTLRTEIAESFITSLKNVFAENYIEVPKADKDLVESLNARVVELQVQVKEAQSSIVSSKKQNESLLRKSIVAEAAKGLATTQASKLNELTRDSVFESAEAFKKKVAVIKESFFAGKTPQSKKFAPILEQNMNETVRASGAKSSEVIVEGQEDSMAHVSNDMKRYMGAISRAEAHNPNRKAQ